VNVRFLEPVFAGQKLEYEVHLERESMGVLVYAVRATVDSVVVVDGTMSGSINRVVR
jgi:3-hydroxymyristoyl/3-hydroxydecanoyl-(acyl carrier protein) dehydratase